MTDALQQPGYSPSAWGREYHSLPHDEALGAGAAGPGKALDVSTPIATETGWKTMGSLVVGDQVFDDQGALCTVLFKSEVFHGKECYRLEFDDGSEIVADAEHVWPVLDYADRQALRRQEKRAFSRTGLNDQRSKCRTRTHRTTSEIAQTLLARGRRNHAIMVTRPLQLKDGALPVDPWVLGLWLGDGCSASGMFATNDPEIAERVGQHYLVAPSKEPYMWQAYGLSSDLRALRLNGVARTKKRIPLSYLRGSETARMELLRGLVDSDGHIDSDGRCEITLCNETLARDTWELILTLGFKVTFRESDAQLNGRVVGRRWRIAFHPMGRGVAWLPRKRSRIGTGSRTSRWRYIVACDRVESRPVQCIQVDSPNHLYLAGPTLIPTHNTEVLLHEPLAQIYVEHQRCIDRTHPFRHSRMGDSTGWALHLRRTTKMLEQTIQRFLRVYPRIDPGMHWSDVKTTATFSSGYRYQFGHCKDPNDYENYMSFELTFLVFDELTQFEEEQYDQIGTRVRSTDPVLSQMLKVRTMSNPLMRRGEVGDAFSVRDPNWVRERFVRPAPQGRVTIKRPIVHPDGEVENRTAIYIPATIDDNPNKAFVKQYRARLLSAKPHIRQALLYGDWFVTPDSFYADEWNPTIHVCKPFAIPSDWKVFRAMDWGFKKPGCVLWFAMDPDDVLYVVKQMMFQGKTDAEIAKAIYIVEDAMGWWQGDKSALTGPADTQLWEERGDSGKTKAQTMFECGVSWVKANKKSRQSNAELITKRLRDHAQGTTRPGLIIFNTCQNLIETLPAIQTDPTFTEVPLDGGDDHAHDTLCYGVSYASFGPVGVATKKKKRDAWLFEDDKDEVDIEKNRGKTGYGM